MMTRQKQFSIQFVLYAAFLSVFLSAVPGSAEPLEQVVPSELAMDESYLPQIDLWIDQLIKADNIPGALVAVGRGDRLALLKMYGQRQRNPVPEPITMDTLYDLASVGKVTALAPSIAMLVDQGKIAYTDKVSKYLPEFTGNGKENITIYDFLTHTSGIKDGYSWEGTSDDIWKRICQLECQSKPGERFEYSCLGFVILGKLVARVSGETFADYARNHIYLPLGMTDTMFLPDPERRKRAAATQFFDGRWIKGEPNDTRSRRMGGGTGNGANFSTIGDMAIYASVILNQGRYQAEDGQAKRLFSSEIFDQMAASCPTTAGTRSRGWDKRSDKANRGALMSPRAIGHGGWTGTTIWVDPAFDTFFVILSSRLNINPDAPNIYPTAAKIADRVIDSIRDPHNETEIRTGVRSAVLSPNDKAKYPFLQGKKVGVITDLDACKSEEKPSAVAMLETGVSVMTVFCRDNESADYVANACRDAGLPIPALCKLSELKPRRLLPPQLDGLDTLVFDAAPSGNGNDSVVTDLGRAMQTAADNRLAFVLLDRANPNGMTDLSGEFPEPGCEPLISFRRLPEQYAMSVGELALMFNSEYRMGLSLSVLPYRETKIDVPGTKENPTVKQTMQFKGDMPWFQYQRELYLIYPR